MIFQKALVINDVHIPFENPRAVDLVFRVAKDLQPDLIFLNGDIMDCWEISKYVKKLELRDKAKLSYEIERTKSFLERVVMTFPKAHVRYIFGNHEYRWAVYIANAAPELFGLKGLSLEEQLNCPGLGIEVINSGNKESEYLWGKLLIGHFDKVNMHSGYTAKNLLEQKSISLIQAHTHRGGSSYKRFYDRDLVAYENFCLCDRSPSYANRPNWQLGFSIVYKDQLSDFFYVEQHPIIEHEKTVSTFFNGKLYKL